MMGQDGPGKQEAATTRPTSQPDLHTCMRVSTDGRAFSSGSRPPFRWERLKTSSCGKISTHYNGDGATAGAHQPMGGIGRFAQQVWGHWEGATWRLRGIVLGAGGAVAPRKGASEALGGQLGPTTQHPTVQWRGR